MAVNAAINDVLALLGALSLVAWIIVNEARQGILAFNAWIATAPLGPRVILTTLVLYVLWRLVGLVAHMAQEQANPLTHRLARNIQLLVDASRESRGKRRDEVAMLTYSYRAPELEYKP